MYRVCGRGSFEHITLFCGASAGGVALPLIIIFAKTFPGGAYKFNGPDDAVYVKSKSGWINFDLDEKDFPSVLWLSASNAVVCGWTR